MSKIQPNNRTKFIRSPAFQKKMKDAVEQFKVYNNGAINFKQKESLGYFIEAIRLEDTRNRENLASKEEVNQYLKNSLKY